MIASAVVHVLTFSRVCLAPFVAHAIMRGQDKRTFFLIICAFATDVLDGWVARTFKQESQFGKLADPVADKIFVLCIVYAVQKRVAIPWALFYFFLVRDAILAAGSIVLWRRFGETLRPSIWGKLAMGLSISSFLLWFGRGIVSGSLISMGVGVDMWSHLCWAIFLCALCASCASFYDYGLSFWEKMKAPLGPMTRVQLARVRYVGFIVWVTVLALIVCKFIMVVGRGDSVSYSLLGE